MTRHGFFHELILFVNKCPDPVEPSVAREGALTALKKRFIEFRMPPHVAEHICSAFETEQAPTSLIDYLLMCPDRAFAEHMLAGVEAVCETTSDKS
jgi:hypothetical protein